MTGNPQDKISARAYAIWIEEGRPDGRDLEHWLQAERELSAPAAKPARKPAAKKVVAPKAPAAAKPAARKKAPAKP